MMSLATRLTRKRISGFADSWDDNSPIPALPAEDAYPALDVQLPEVVGVATPISATGPDYGILLGVLVIFLTVYWSGQK